MGKGAGFTLAEIIIVIAIIVVLGAGLSVFSGANSQSSRDSRRLSDLREVEQALRLFFLKCGFYPGSYNANTNSCVGGYTVAAGGDPAQDNPDDWTDLEDILAGAEIGITKIPYDPLAGQSYEYRVELGDPGLNTPRAQCYWLSANLENPNHQALSDPKELDGIIDTNVIPTLYPQTSLNCNGSAYCLGNIECTYDG